MYIFFVTGMPNSGKDTQAAILARRLRATVLTTSREVLDPFFRKRKRGIVTIEGKRINIASEIRKRMDGRFNSPFLVGHLIREKLRAYVRKGRNVIVAGSPRELAEAKLELAYLRREGLKSVRLQFRFLLIAITQHEAVKRARLRNRADKLDTPAVIGKRFAVFRKQTLPAVRFLKKEKVLVSVSGTGSIPAVSRRIRKAFGV